MIIPRHPKTVLEIGHDVGNWHIKEPSMGILDVYIGIIFMVVTTILLKTNAGRSEGNENNIVPNALTR